MCNTRYCDHFYHSYYF